VNFVTAWVVLYYVRSGRHEDKVLFCIRWYLISNLSNKKTGCKLSQCFTPKQSICRNLLCKKLRDLYGKIFIAPQRYNFKERVYNGCIALRFHNLDTRLRWMIFFTPRPLYVLEKALKRPLNGGQREAGHVSPLM